VLNVTAPDFEARLARGPAEEKPRIFLDAVTGKLGGTRSSTPWVAARAG
jgi:hypothetical protein